MEIRSFIESTYLKNAAQAQLDPTAYQQFLQEFVQEAIQEQYKLVMVRPEVVKLTKQWIASQKSNLLVGTVVDFPLGQSELSHKIELAKQAIADGADELDFVCNYEAFKKGNDLLVKQEIIKCSAVGLNANKVVKWIIEVAALSPQEIVKLTVLIKNCIVSQFKEIYYDKVYVKSSTGFYETPTGSPNGATIDSIVLMLENAYPLPVKAAGGVRSYKEAMEMTSLGVKRIGTSAAKSIVYGSFFDASY
jgi:deoxyribose-phosphate aldolase